MGTVKRERQKANRQLRLEEIAKQALLEIRLEDVQFHRPLAAIYKKTKVLSPAMKQFLAVLKGEKTQFV